MKAKRIISFMCLCMCVLIAFSGCTMTEGAVSTYTVTYDGNGATSGSVPVDSNKYKYYDAITVKANASNLARTGYKFSSWNSESDGSGTSYQAGETLYMGKESKTLYAFWVADTTETTYTVTYNGNGNTGGSAPTDSNTYKSGDTVYVTPPDSTMVKTGYEFVGWNKDMTATTSTTYNPYDSFTMPAENITLYAIWGSTALGTASITTINFNTNGTGLTVTWNKVTNASSYILYRSTTSTGTFTKIKTGLTDADVEYTDTSITTTVANQTYYYKVGAINSQGTEVRSSAKGVKIPKAVVNFTSTAKTKLQVSFVPSGSSSGDTVYTATTSTLLTGGTLFTAFDGPSGTYTIGWQYITTSSGTTWTAAPATGTTYEIKPGKTYSIIFEMSGHTISSVTSEPLLTQL